MGMVAPFTNLTGSFVFVVLRSLKDSTRSMYCCMASSVLVPLTAAQASYFARPTMAVKRGRDPVTSPALACLNRPYILSFTSLPGASDRFFESAAAASNLFLRSLMVAVPLHRLKTHPDSL